MPDNTVELRITAKDEATSVLNSLGNTLKALAAGYVSFKGFEDLVTVVNEAQVAMLEFQHAFDTFGDHVQYTRQQLLDFAETASRTTTLSRDQVISGEAELLKFTNLTGDTFDKARQAMLNMAATTGDTAGAARQLGLILENPITGFRLLRQAGIALTTQQREQIQMLTQQGQSIQIAVYLLDLLNQRMLDATKYTETLGGAFDQVKNALKEGFQGAPDGANALVGALHELRDTLKDPEVQEGLYDITKGVLMAAEGWALIAKYAVELGKGVKDYFQGQQKDEQNKIMRGALQTGKIPGGGITDTWEAVSARMILGVSAGAAITPDQRVRFMQALGLSGTLDRGGGGGNAPATYGGGHSILDQMALGGVGNIQLPQPFGRAFFQPNQLAYAASAGGYDETALAKVMGFDPQMIAKFAAADKATLTDLEKSWAEYADKIHMIAVDPLLQPEERAKRAEAANEIWLRSTQTAVEGQLSAYEDFVEKASLQFQKGQLAPTEFVDRVTEQFQKLTQVTRTDAGNAVVNLSQQLKDISRLGDQGGGAEGIQKFVDSIRGLGTELLDPLEQSQIKFTQLAQSLERWQAALRQGLFDAKTPEEAATLSEALANVDRYLTLLPEHARIAATQVGQAQTQLVQALQNSFQGFFNNTHEGLRGFVEDFLKAFQQILASAMAMDLVDALGLGAYIGRPNSSGGFVGSLFSGIGSLFTGPSNLTVSASDWSSALASLGTVTSIFPMAGGGVLPAGSIAQVGESGTEWLIPQQAMSVVPKSKLGGSTAINYAPVTNISGTGLSAAQLSAVIAANNQKQREEMFRTMDRNGLGRMR